MLKSKGLYLFIYYLILAVFCSLVFSSVITTYKATGKADDGVSSESLKVNFKAGKSKQTIDDFVLKLQQHVPSFLLLKSTDSLESMEVYIHHHSFPLAGEETIEKLAPQSILIDENYERNIIHNKKGEFFSANGLDYKVENTFTPMKNTLDIMKVMYITMNTRQPLQGEFIVDGISKNEFDSVLKELQKEDKTLVGFSKANHKDFKAHITLVLQNQIVVLIVLLLSVVLIIINSVSGILTWIESRRAELKVRFLVGANFAQLRKGLIKDFSRLVLYSFIIGVCIAYFLFKMNLFGELLTQFEWSAILLAFLFCYTLGLLIALPSIAYNVKKQMTEKQVRMS